MVDIQLSNMGDNVETIIKGISYYLPERVLTNEQLASEFPDWTIEKIQEKTGIHCRHIAAEGECASDLGVMACRELFDSGICQPEDIDFLLLCTQSPDYYLPTSACLMQEELGLPTSSGALDFNLGCSGYIYGLGLAKGLVETGQARNILLVTAETYSKHINVGDRSVRTLFGDAAAATLLGTGPVGCCGIGPFVYGTDGRGGKNLIVPAGALRQPRSRETAIVALDDQGNSRSLDNIFMDGPEIFTFTLNSVPPLIAATLEKASYSMEDIDYFVFHQANLYMLESLRRKIRIPKEKFLTSFEDCGNTVSSTIPIVLKNMTERGVIRSGHRVMLVGFGVGYSWGATIISWN
jgi:3-oxoacyl-[acyl-carrier-protein] synthase III